RLETPRSERVLGVRPSDRYQGSTRSPDELRKERSRSPDSGLRDFSQDHPQRSKPETWEPGLLSDQKTASRSGAGIVAPPPTILQKGCSFSPLHRHTFP